MLGLGTLSQLSIETGPPANYELAFTAGDGIEIKARTNVQTRVAFVEPLNTPGIRMNVQPNQQFPLTPRARISDKTGSPLA